MTRFIETVPVALTPLTPIHIGCGEDFEPTNYVIERGMLHQFDPARITLTSAERDELLRAVNRQGDDAIRALQSFFYNKRARCIEASRMSVPVAAGVDEWYSSRVGKVAQRESGGRTVSNQLEIERTAHHPHSGKPYLPGSSLKGSIRTAWLNQIDPSGVVERDPSRRPDERAGDVEAELLGGTFFRDPFRQLKVADADGPTVTSRVVFCVDRDKEQKLSRTGDRIEKNLFVRREVILGGQYRAMVGEIRFDRLSGIEDGSRTPAKDKRINSFGEVAQACNRFYLPRLKSDLALIRRRFADDPWIARVVALVAALQPMLDAGRTTLLRVGRHSGAESVTLQKRRWIQIRGGKRRPTSWSRDATTIWLAAERENSLAELLPFGWLLVEADPASENAALRDWCGHELVRTPVVAVPSTCATALPAAAETVWDKARLRFNAKNETLTAVGPGNVEANALAPRSLELLAALPAELQRRVRANDFVRVSARVVGNELVSVEARQ